MDKMKIVGDGAFVGISATAFLGIPWDQWVIYFAVVYGAATAAMAVWNLYERIKAAKAAK